jgi:hypothetical protein
VATTARTGGATRDIFSKNALMVCCCLLSPSRVSLCAQTD